jgi:hypothetical protein
VSTASEKQLCKLVLSTELATHLASHVKVFHIELMLCWRELVSHTFAWYDVAPQWMHLDGCARLLGYHVLGAELPGV